ncbi:PAS domain S-box protein [Methanoculleus sp. FWC-SCC1]|uniref:histidine kinase n=1 Tax=Methanoculleus frigidifontis TaxID=2584085 RepID=A0ABT8M781_9EURY|nr:PAS domain S-box protein [Methanoculleus sp. FWC-SCC1]MDN7023789.1 PAS domain S-box protein [Methanoculleus sp. FWC-SCC1]
MISVLYVDDEPALLDITRHFLEKSGEMTVDTVPSAGEAIERLRHRTYDAIVSDYQMPVMDGIAFLQYVRSKFDSLPFILFTGRGREEVVIEALNTGADFYLQKGSDPKTQFRELEHKVKHAVYRRRAEVQLLQSEKRMTDIINFLPDATFAIDPEGRVIAWNRATEEMTGIAAEDIVGKGDFEYALPFYGERRRTLIDLVLKCDPNYSRQQYANISRNGGSITVETEYAHPQGRKVVLWAKASPLYDEDGTLTGAIESVRDITALKTAQQELEQKNEELMASNEQLAAAEEEIRQQMDEIVVGKQELEQKNEELMASNEQLAAAEEEIRQQMDELAAAHDELRKNEARYRAVVEEQTELICRFTPDFICSFVNEAFCRFFGKQREELLKKRVDTAFSLPDNSDRIRAALEGLTPEHPDTTIDQRMILADGTVRWVRWNVRALYYYPSGIFGYQAVGRDTTGYMRMKHALEQRYRFEKTIAAVSSRFITCDDFDAAVHGSLRDIGILSAASRAYLFLFDDDGETMNNTHEWCAEGVSPQRDTLQHLPCDTFPWWMARLRRGEVIAVPDVAALPADASVEREVLESQEIRSVLVLPVQNRGEVIGFIGLDNVVYTTEWHPEDAELLRISSEIIGGALVRKRMEEGLREREAHFQFLVNHSSDVFVIVNPDAAIRYISPVAADITGYPIETFTGSIFDHIHPEDIPLLRGYWSDLIDDRSASVRFDFRMAHKNGNVLYLEGLAQSYLDDPSIRGIIVNIRDVTERKRTERAVQEANRKLHLLSNVTRHDILNQVMVQLGYIDIARQESPSPELTECARNIEAAARTIQRQIEFTRDYQNLGIRNPVWVRIADVVADLPASPITVGSDLPAIEIFADPLLEKVFENLLDNTLRHAAGATGVCVSYRTDPGGLTILWEDDGAGIPDDQKERIFKRGYGKNTGLGLYLVREILAITGIAIRETGVPGEGARFEIAVPGGAYRVSADA